MVLSGLVSDSRLVDLKFGESSAVASSSNLPAVYVVILSWNGREFLPACLDSVRLQTYRNRTVVVVDNGSTDGSQGFIQQQYPEVILIENGCNLGFSEGNNVGLRFALEAGADYVVLLNQDTKVETKWLEELVKLAEGDRWIGGVASHMRLFTHKTLVNSTGIEMNCAGSAWDRGFGRVDGTGYRWPIEVLGVTGGAMFFNQTKRITMNSTRIISFTLCLGLACLLMMGNALAGTTEVSEEIKYACEVGGAGTQYVIPTGNSIVRTLSILPSASFFVKVSLDGNAEFDSEGGGGLPEDGDLTQTAGGTPVNIASLLGTPADGATSVEYLVRVTNDFEDFPVFTFDTRNWGIEDPDNVLGGGGTINVTVTTRASNTGAMIDTGTDSDAWLRGIYGVTVTEDSLKSTTATVDVATARTEFVKEKGDTPTMDKGATLGLSDMTAMALAADGTTYELAATDTIELVVTGDLTGITEIVWNDDGVADTMADGEMRLAQSDEDFDLANGVATLKLAGDNDGIDRLLRLSRSPGDPKAWKTQPTNLWDLMP